MSERDELANLIARRRYAKNARPSVWITGRAALELAGIILAAGWRKSQKVTTAKELDALGLRSIIRDNDGETWELTDNGWRYWVYDEAFQSLEITLPATVLHEPEATK